MAEEERKFSQDQYDMLKRCSVKKNMTEWNEWRRKNPDEKILLKKAELKGACLQHANLQGANLGGANLQEAILEFANLREAKLELANLQKANLWKANLQGAEFEKADLQGARLDEANLKGAKFNQTKLQKANFRKAIVDGETLIWDCKIDRETNFSGVGLDAIRIHPGTKQLLEYKDKSEEVRFSQEQYDILKRCSDAKDISEWNEWREKNPEEEILFGPYLQEAYLHGVNLRKAWLEGANLQGAELLGVHLQEANLKYANLQKANLEGANLQEAGLLRANLQEAGLLRANLQEANLKYANLQKANLAGANLQKAKFEDANLKGAKFSQAKLQKANFRKTIVDGETLIWACEIDRETNFSGVGLDAIRIQPGAKQLLEYNNRCRNWGWWYKKHKFLQWPVKWFWGLSDYGISTGRVLGWFMFFAISFAMIYYVWGWVDVYGLGIDDRPGVVSNLFVLENTNEAVAWNQVPVRSIYFSVITMTTLGFGDMYANPATSKDNPYAQARSGWGHFLLMIQVLLGYVMLGALVTRFAVLFTAGGPAGEFKEAENSKQAMNKKDR